MAARIVVVGAGLAGLVCSRELLRAGLKPLLLEAGDGVGGRVRSDLIPENGGSGGSGGKGESGPGYILDRGFQVLFTAYPAARRQLNYSRLDLRRYEPGAIICQGTRRHILSDPLRDPWSALPSLLTDLVPQEDKLRTFALTQELRGKPLEVLSAEPDETTEAFLRRRGFSERYLDNFLRRFFGGIFLSDTLTTSARAFRFYWKMLSEGDTAVPARGIGQIAWQLAEELTAAGCIQLGTRVTELKRTPAGRCTGIRTEDGEVLETDLVILATPASETARLSGLPMPEGRVGTVTLYLAGEKPLVSGRKLLLHANRGVLINNVAPVTNIAPELAPPGRHLIAASTLGVPEGSDGTLLDETRRDLRRMFAGDKSALAALETYRLLAIYRIPFAQFAQPPGVWLRLPEAETGVPGLLLAGEVTGGSNLNAAMESGERAAAHVLARL